MLNQQFNDSSSSLSLTSSQADDDSSLPFPKALPRSDFVQPDFDPSVYLSSLGDRHQTLEDLRTELRDRSQFLHKELLDLVNANYQDFVSLGGSFKGGDERVEELRVGLLGFAREVGEVRNKVKQREVEVDLLLMQRVEIRQQITVGRRLLEYDARLTRLEAKLMLDSTRTVADAGPLDSDASSLSSNSSEEEEAEDEDDVQKVSGMPSPRLTRRIREFLDVQKFSEGCHSKHPYVVAQLPRLTRIRKTLLVDLTTLLKQAKAVESKDVGLIMKIAALCREMNAAREAVQALSSSSAK